MNITTNCLSCDLNGKAACATVCVHCEHNNPAGKYNLHQPVLHTILMVSTEGEVRKFEGVYRTNTTLGNIMLIDFNRNEMARFPNDESWAMIDLTPTMGWNERAASSIEHESPKTAEDMPQQEAETVSTLKVAKVGLSDISVFRMPKPVPQNKNIMFCLTATNGALPASINENPVDVLRDFVRDWLHTKQGWDVYCQSDAGFNWMTLCSHLPISLNGITLSKEPEDGTEADWGYYDSVSFTEPLMGPGLVPATAYTNGLELGTCKILFCTGLVTRCNWKIPPQAKTLTASNMTVKTDVGELPIKWNPEVEAYFLVKPDNKTN